MKKLDWTKIVPEKHFRYSAKANKNEHDGYMVPLRVLDENGEECTFVHQAPELILTFGIQEKEVAGKKHYKTVFSFPTLRYDNGTWTGNQTYIDYYQWIVSIDKYNKEHVFKNMKTLFPSTKKMYKREVLDEFYFNNTWEGEKCLSGEYSPTFSTKLSVRKEAIATKFFDDTRKEHFYDELRGEASKYLRCIPLIKTTGIWFAGKNFGMSYQLVQMLYFRKDEFVGCAIDMGEVAESTSIPRLVMEEEEDPETCEITNGNEEEEEDDDDAEEKTSKRQRVK